LVEYIIYIVHHMQIYLFLIVFLYYSNTYLAFFLTPWLREKLLAQSSPNKAGVFKKENKNQYSTTSFIQGPGTKQFFGMIGPNIHPEKVENLFELFTGDGIIQGIFIQNNNITFTKHLIQTDKKRNEENLSPKSKKDSIGMILLKYFGYLIGINKINNLGAANTAILPISIPVDENTTAAYALFERDHPYLLHFYHNTSTIETIRKVKTPYYLSGHSKNAKDMDGNTIIETIDYHIFSKKVMYYTMNENLTQVLTKSYINTHYIPIIHDFLSTKDNIVIVDSPLVFDFAKLFRGKLPIHFASELPTYIHVLHKNTGHITSYKLYSAFYVFHFAKYIDTYHQLEIYAPLYDIIDFDSIKIKGRYRKIVLDKCHKTAVVCTNAETEKYNLDFPVINSLGDIILRNIAKRRINGFVKVNNLLDITKKWLFQNIFFCGEPISVMLNNKNGLIAFGNNDDGPGGIVLLNMDDGTVMKYSLNCNLTMGFHTVSINRN